MTLGDADEFIIVDCPGQIELYTHYDVIPKLVETFQRHDYSVVVLYLMESNYLLDVGKVHWCGVECNGSDAQCRCTASQCHHQVGFDGGQDGACHWGAGGSGLNHTDVVDDDYEDESHPLHPFFYPNPQLLLERLHASNPGYLKLNQALVQLLDEYDIVSFIGLNIKREESIQRLVAQIDNAVQYGEQLEPKESETAFGEAEDEDE